MATNWNRTGSASVTNGSTAVAGTLTAWLAIARQGDGITFDGGGTWYEIAAVGSNTALTLGSAFAGTTGTYSSPQFAINPNGRAWNSYAKLAADLADYIAKLIAYPTPAGVGDGLKQVRANAGGTALELFTQAPFASDDSILINGEFQINQRVFAGGSLAAGVYGYDRWRADSLGASITVLGYAVTLASGTVQQIVEPSLWGYANLASATLTVSVQSLSGGNLTVTAGSTSGTIVAGSGPQSVTLTTAAGDTGNLPIKIGALGGSATFSRLKVAVAPAITPYLSRSRPLDLKLARRCWQKSFPYATIPGGNKGAPGVVYMQALAAGAYTHQQSVPLAEPMRAAPVITFYNPNANNNQCRNISALADCANTQVASGTSSEDRFGVYTETPGSTAVAHALLFHWVADAEL